MKSIKAKDQPWKKINKSVQFWSRLRRKQIRGQIADLRNGRQHIEILNTLNGEELNTVKCLYP